MIIAIFLYNHRHFSTFSAFMLCFWDQLVTHGNSSFRLFFTSPIGGIGCPFPPKILNFPLFPCRFGPSPPPQPCHRLLVIKVPWEFVHSGKVNRFFDIGPLDLAEKRQGEQRTCQDDFWSTDRSAWSATYFAYIYTFTNLSNQFTIQSFHNYYRNK